MQNKLRSFFQNFGNFFNRQNALLAFGLVAILILPTHFAHAGLLDWILKGVIAAVMWVVAQIVLGLSQALLGVSASLMMTIADPSFVCVRWEGNQCMSSRYTEISFVRDGIILCRDLAGIFLVMALISIGIGVALKLLDAKQSLTKFAVSAILVFITPIITGPIIDFSNVFMFSFLKTGAASGVLGQIQLVDAFMDIFGKSWSQDASFASFFLTVISALLALLAFALFAAYTMFRIAILLLSRYVALWLLIMLAPLAFAMQALGQLRGQPYFKFFEQMGQYYERWWREFIAWCFTGINVALFIYIAGRVSLALAGSESKLFRSSPIGGEVFYIINISADFGNIISIIMPILIPLIILHMGYKLSLEWGASGATAVIGAADGMVNLGKTALLGVGGAAGGAMMGKALASGAGQKALTGIQGMTTATAKDSKFGKWLKNTSLSQSINAAASRGLEKGDKVIGQRQKAADEKITRAKKLDERMEAQGREGKYMENLATVAPMFEPNYQERAKLIELAKKGKIPGLKDEEKQKILSNKSIDTKTRKAMVEADQFILNDPILGEQFLNVYNTKDVKDAGSIAMNEAINKAGVDLTGGQGEKRKSLLKEIFKSANFGRSYDSEMTALGLTDAQQQDIREARQKFYDKVKEQAVKDAIGSLNKEKLDNLSHEDLMKPDLIEKIAKYSKDKDVIMGAAKRGGSQWFEQYVQAIPPDKINRTIGMFSADDFKSMGASTLSAPATLQPMMANISKPDAFGAYMSQLPDDPQINQQIQQIINDPAWQANALKNNNTAGFNWAATLGARNRQIKLNDIHGNPIDFTSDTKAAKQKIQELINARVP
ncbi:MAG: hypothetical protein WC449_04395 [Candidatus Paceibacterota bacterium]